MVFFAFPEDTRWNDQLKAVEFTVQLGEYQGTVRVGRRVFQRLLHQSPTPQRCLEAFHLQRTRFEMAVERKLLHPLSDRCLNWLDENVAIEDWQWFGNSVAGGGLAVEPRYLDTLVEELVEAGFAGEEE